MNNTNLKDLLYEYQKKRDFAELKARELKKEIYSKNNRLEEIDSQLAKFSIDTAKSLLSNNSKELLGQLNLKIATLKNEKKTILKNMGISENDLLPKYECSICKDTGYIQSGYNTKMCACLEQRLFDLEYNSSNVYNMHNHTFEKFNSSYYSDTPDKEKYGSNISPRQNIEIIKKLSLNFINNFDNIEEKNLLFTGNSGLGKTFLSSCIANSLLKKGKTVLYQTAPIMLDSIINFKLRKIYIQYQYL